MWVKTRQEVELGIDLSILTHDLIVTQPSVASAVIGIDEDGSINGFSVNGADAELPLSVVPRLPRLRELLVASDVELPANLVFSRVQGDISAKVHQISGIPTF
jgi:hypothetical protein